MEGNNKLTPFTSMNVIARNPGQAVSKIPQTEACLIYDISGGGMHLRLLRKSHLGPGVDSGDGHVASRPRSAEVKVTAGARFAFPAGRYIVPVQEIFFLL
jgi:hypothetical protein